MKIASARDALVFLSRQIYQRYVEEVLPLIAETWHRLGIGAGERRKKDLPVSDLNTAVRTLWGSERNIIEKLEKKKVRLVTPEKGRRCPLGLENAGRKLCETMMRLDQGMLEALIGNEVGMDIVHTVAAGDKKCEIIYSVIESNS